MSAIGLDDIREFLDRYGTFANEAKARRLANLTLRFDRFKEEFTKIRRRSWERARRDAPDFNIFTLLRVERIEAQHSRMLAELLDPAGTHGQGPFFLNSFVAYCQDVLDGFPSLFEREPTRSDFVIVKKEFGSVYGRPDIAIYSKNPAFALIIENKIDAGDQEKQLERYWKLLHSRFDFARECKALIYLSPLGRRPEKSEQIPPEVHYYCLSYRTHIAGWLKSCAAEVPPRVGEVLGQYREVVEKLVIEEMEDQSDGQLED